jgi:hypothetical protein
MKELKSANQLYKESGSSLPFKQWVEREKDKGNFMYANGLQSKVNTIIADNIDSATSETEVPMLPKNEVFGINKFVLLGLGLVIVTAIGYSFFNKRK